MCLQIFCFVQVFINHLLKRDIHHKNINDNLTAKQTWQHFC
jgi:hypothetical protein